MGSSPLSSLQQANKPLANVDSRQLAEFEKRRDDYKRAAFNAKAAGDKDAAVKHYK